MLNGNNEATAETVPEQRMRYNGKELHTELGLGWVDYGARMYEPSIGRWNGVDALAEEYIAHTPYSYVQNQPINAFDINGDSTVVVVAGNSETWYTSPTGEKFLLYNVSVYTNLSLSRYQELERSGELPKASFVTQFARDAHDVKSNGVSVNHSADRYGSRNETPPGTYYLFRPGTNGDEGGGSYDLYVGSSNGSRVINGPDGDREGVAFHQYDPRDSQGCFTACEGRSTEKVTDLINAIPDLNNDTQPVRLIVSERPVERLRWANSANGATKFKGTASKPPVIKPQATSSWWSRFNDAWMKSTRAIDRSVRRN